jgi:hypothetical protein
MTEKNTLKQMKTSFLQKCFCTNNIAYFVAIFGILFVVMIGIFLQKRLGIVKEQLESCRSSCRSV